MRSHHRYLRICLALLGVAMVGAGCGGSGTATPKADNHSATGKSGPSSAGSGSSEPARSGSSAAAAADDVRCHTGELKVTSHALGAAAGSHYAQLRFTNVSRSSCRVYGFPGMKLLGGSGKAVPTKVVRDPSSKPKLVTLAPGDTATARASWSAVPGRGETGGGQCEPSPARAEVTPPDETDHKIIPWSYGPACQHGRIVVTALK